MIGNRDFKWKKLLIEFSTVNISEQKAHTAKISTLLFLIIWCEKKCLQLETKLPQLPTVKHEEIASILKYKCLIQRLSERYQRAYTFFFSLQLCWILLLFYLKLSKLHLLRVYCGKHFHLPFFLISHNINWDKNVFQNISLQTDLIVTTLFTDSKKCNCNLKYFTNDKLKLLDFHSLTEKKYIFGR